MVLLDWDVTKWFPFDPLEVKVESGELLGDWMMGQGIFALDVVSVAETLLKQALPRPLSKGAPLFWRAACGLTFFPLHRAEELSELVSCFSPRGWLKISKMLRMFAHQWLWFAFCLVLCSLINDLGIYGLNLILAACYQYSTSWNICIKSKLQLIFPPPELWSNSCYWSGARSPDLCWFSLFVYFVINLYWWDNKEKDYMAV